MSPDGVLVGGWIKNSFIDFPGTVATVLFFSGCNLACPWCHNPGIVRGSHGPVDCAEIATYLERRRGIIEGVVLSGGEPTIHPGLPDLARELRGRGLKVKLDTNGLLPAAIEQCAPDYLALDVKTLPQHYGRLGCRYADVAERLSRSIAIVKSMGERAEVRVTVAPGFVDEESIAGIAPLLSGVARVFLQPLKTDVELLDPAFAQKPVMAPERIA
ncbi:MAG: anaerobic ribonucleoside-triphosphate reductase activating protein, partial [Chitinispirillaceae bacterium]|nr:anaerobic ribonucleoside-triphosphate reductase activating protein [Chitinispirillaceae bacterium]